MRDIDDLHAEAHAELSHDLTAARQATQATQVTRLWPELDTAAPPNSTPGRADP